MDDVDLQLNFAMCFDHFQHNDLGKEDQYKTPQGSKDNSPNGNESESIEVVETPSNTCKGPLQESTISSASTNNTDICVLDSQYANDDLGFLPDDDDEDFDEREFFESDDPDEVFVRAVDVVDKHEEFTMLQKPVKSRRLCKCEESTEVLMLINSEYQGKRRTTYSGTDSDVEVLMSEEIGESDWSSGNIEDKIDKSIACESSSEAKDERCFTSCSIQEVGDGGVMHKEESTDLDVSGAELADNIADSYQNLNRAQMLQLIHQQEERIQALEATVERYHKAQQRLFEHVDALRLELSEIRISPLPQTDTTDKPIN